MRIWCMHLKGYYKLLQKILINNNIIVANECSTLLAVIYLIWFRMEFPQRPTNDFVKKIFLFQRLSFVRRSRNTHTFYWHFLLLYITFLLSKIEWWQSRINEKSPIEIDVILVKFSIVSSWNSQIFLLRWAFLFYYYRCLCEWRVCVVLVFLPFVFFGRDIQFCTQKINEWRSKWMLYFSVYSRHDIHI